MQKLKLTIILFTTLLLSACGGISTNPIETIKNVNEFNKKAAIFIIKGASRGVCESPLFKGALEQNLLGVITSEAPKATTCNTFGRTNSRTTCYEEDYTNPGNIACIIGYNNIKDNDNNDPILGQYIILIIVNLFILFAE